MIKQKPILVTGMSRSGTTWVGRILAEASGVHYVHEPFNLTGIPCVCGIHPEYWYQHISDENEHRYYAHINHLIHPAFNKVTVMNVLRRAKANRRIRTLLSLTEVLRARRVVVKDPLATLSVKWLASKFDMEVIILVRHPAAVASSYQRLGWTPPFSHFLAQPSLMKAYLSSHEHELRDFIETKHDIAEQAGMLWKLVYHAAFAQMAGRGNIRIILYEDLAFDPEDGFENLFGELQLAFSEGIRDKIKEYSNDDHADPSPNPYSIRRNSVRASRDWRARLSAKQVAKIRSRVEKISAAYYSDEEW